MQVNDGGSGNSVSAEPDLVADDSTVNFNGCSDCKIEIAKGCNFRGSNFHFSGSGHSLIFGNNANLYGMTIIMKGSGNAIRIGDDFIGGLRLRIVLDEGSGCLVSIGDGCIFASDILLRNNDGHKIIDKESNTHLNPCGNIIIESRVWLGERVYVLKNAHIKSDTVVGACSVVTKGEFPSNVVLAGNPAIIKKSGIKWKF